MERTPGVRVGEPDDLDLDLDLDLYSYVKANAPPRQRMPGPLAPLSSIGEAYRDWQAGPGFGRPNIGESFIPVWGPGREAFADLHDGNYGAAAFNGAMAVADVLPIAVAAKGAHAASLGIKILKEGSVSADAARKAMRRVGFAKPGQEIHHTIPLNGTSRNAQDWRNHYAFLKPLPKEVHRRLTGSWKGEKMYDPIRKVWYGTTDWMKAIPAGVAGYVADSVENVSQAMSPPPKPPLAKPSR